jgi:heat shock protein HtpX
MALTYTEIERQKNVRIVLFFLIVLLFYFLTALVVGNVVKLALIGYLRVRGHSPFLGTQGMLWILVFAGIAAAGHIFYSVSNAMSLIKRQLGIQAIDLEDRYHKRFAAIVDEVNVATGSRYKITPVVMPTVAMNAFAISDHKGRAIVGVTEGLLSKLTRQQLQAVVAHEIAHVASDDSLQTTIGCSLFGIYAAMVAGTGWALEHNTHTRGRGGGLLLLIAALYLVLRATQFFYRLIRLSLSRDRELRADAIAVRLTRDPISLSEALYSISRGWRGMGYIDPNLGSLFILNPAVEERDEKEDFWANLLSTHPPVKKRMRILAALAHADVRTIQEKVIRGERLSERSRDVTTEEEQPMWMLMDNERNWQGPFSIKQIAVLGSLTPDTWIKPLDADQVLQAKEAPLLKPLLDTRLEGFKTSSMQCPACKQALIEEEYEGSTVHRCVFCGGALVEKDRISRIALRTEKGFDERIQRLAGFTQRSGLEKSRRRGRKPVSLLTCPGCGGRMLRNFYSLAYFVEIDKCFTCDLLWFDKDELEILQYLVENKGKTSGSQV